MGNSLRRPVGGGGGRGSCTLRRMGRQSDCAPDVTWHPRYVLAYASDRWPVGERECSDSPNIRGRDPVNALANFRRGDISAVAEELLSDVLEDHVVALKAGQHVAFEHIAGARELLLRHVLVAELRELRVNEPRARVV